MMEALFRFLFAFISTLLIIKRSYKKRQLSTSGCAAAFFVGLLITFSNLCHFTSLLSFFYICNKATKFKETQKKKIGAEFNEGGQRNASQVLSNGFFPTFFSLIYLIDCGFGERPIDFVRNYSASWYSIAVLAGLCCSCGDTLASELGTVLGPDNHAVFHLVKRERVPKGTNGGVSLYGTLSSLIGGFFVGSIYYLTLRISFFINDGPKIETLQWPIILIGVFSGFFGSMIDSLIGGYFQYSGLDKRTMKITDIKGQHVERISGHEILNNNQVNCISSLITSLVIPYFSFRIYKYF